MARVPYNDPDDLPEDRRDLLRRNVNLLRAMTHSLDCCQHFSRFAQWVRFESRLDPRLRELAILQVGYLARSPYEYSHHLKICLDFGVTEDDIRDLAAYNEGRENGFGELERLVLQGAAEMTEEGEMRAATFEALAGHFDHERMIDLVVITGTYCGLVRILASLDIEVEPEYQTHLDKFPLPGGGAA